MEFIVVRKLRAVGINVSETGLFRPSALFLFFAALSTRIPVVKNTPVPEKREIADSALTFLGTVGA